MLNSSNSAPVSLAQEPAARKHFTTLQARAALAGFALNFFEDSRCHFYMVSRWNSSRTFGTLAEVETWLDRLEHCA